MSEEKVEQRIKCNKCKVALRLENFEEKRDGILFKSCNKCRVKSTEYMLSKEKKVVGCDLCDYKSSNNSHLQRHLWGIHDISTSDVFKFHNCPEIECKSKFKIASDLNRHLWTNHNISVSESFHFHNCPEIECKSKFKSPAILNGHLWQVHNISVSKSYCFHNCSQDECKSKFKTSHELNRHLWTNHNISVSDVFKFHNCPEIECKSIFKTIDELNSHLWQVHNISVSDVFKFHNCPKENCDAYFKFASQLQKHLTTCTGSNTSISGLELRCMEALAYLGFEQHEDYIYNKSFSELTDWSGKSLRPDIRFIHHKIIIELDGEQHYKPRTFGGISEEQSEENFKLTQENDKLKNDFCRIYGYKMIRIPYTYITDMLTILHLELQDIIEF